MIDARQMKDRVDGGDGIERCWWKRQIAHIQPLKRRLWHLPPGQRQHPFRQVNARHGVATIHEITGGWLARSTTGIENLRSNRQITGEIGKHWRGIE